MTDLLGPAILSLLIAYRLATRPPLHARRRPQTPARCQHGFRDFAPRTAAVMMPWMAARAERLRALLAESILVLDGATGTYLQGRDLGPAEFGGAVYEW